MAITGIVFWSDPHLQAQEHITLGNTLPSRGDSALVFELVKRGKALQNSDTDSALALFKKAEAISLARNYPDGVGYALGYMGWAESKRGNAEAAFRYFERALPYCLRAKNAPLVLGYLYHHMAADFLYRGDLVNGRVYFQKSLSLFETHLPENNMSLAIYVSLADIQSRMGGYEKALRYAEYVISHAREPGKERHLAHAMLAKGGIFYTIDKPNLAVHYYQEAWDLIRKLEDPQLYLIYYTDMGNSLLKKKQYVDAAAYFKKAIQMNAGENMPFRGYILPRYSLGSALSDAGKYDEAARVLMEALKKAEATGIRQNESNGHGVLSVVYLRMGKFKKSLEHMRQFIILKDREYKTEKLRAINEIDTRYQVVKKDKALIQQELQIARQQEKIRKTNLLLGRTAGGITFLALLGIAIYRYRRKIKSRELEIDRLKASISGEERERARISRELHDGLGGMLTGIKLNLRALQKDAEPERLPKKLDNIMLMLQEMGEELHLTAHNLMPEALQKHALREALELYCRQLQTGELDLQLQFHNDPEVPDKTRELAIYRIIQELIQNIVKHAKASLAVIQIGKNGSLLCVSAEDNGVGFDKGQRQTGLGLENIRMRVQALNGYYALSSSPGRGTTSYIEIDLK